MSKFKYNVIGNNTPQNRDGLNTLEYKYDCFCLNISAKKIFTSNGTIHFADSYISVESEKELVDCTHSDLLFRAVSAIKEDSDSKKFFISESGDFFQNLPDKFEGYLNPETGEVENATEATIDDIIEYFKNVEFWNKHK